MKTINVNATVEISQFGKLRKQAKNGEDRHLNDGERKIIKQQQRAKLISSQTPTARILKSLLGIV